MARPKNVDKYEATKMRLLEHGMALMRSQSYSGLGINDVLKAAKAPNGSFYHYFGSKEAFGLEVANHYHSQQMQFADDILEDSLKPPLVRLKYFFEAASEEFRSRKYADGCLMCNLSTELADTSEIFQKNLKRHWKSLTRKVAKCISLLDRNEIGLSHLSDQEAADWLMNAWSGALVRMKADRSGVPLKLFVKSVFGSTSS